MQLGQVAKFVHAQQVDVLGNSLKQKLRDLWSHLSSAALGKSRVSCKVFGG